MRKEIIGLREYALPIVFSIICTYWTMTLFFGMPLIGTLLMAVILNCIFFIWFDCMKRMSRMKSELSYLFISIAYLFTVLIILEQSSNLYEVGYFSWIGDLQVDTNFKFGFWLGTLLFLVYFFSSAIFYFAYVSFRMPVVLLISMVPLSLHTLKISQEINMPFIIFTIAFFLLYSERTRRRVSSKDLKNDIVGYKYFQGMSVFITLTVVISVLIPKPDRIPKIISLENVLKGTISTTGMNTQNVFNPGKLTDSDYINAASAPLGDNILFEVKSDEPLYLRIQSWDEYESNHWKTGDSMLDWESPIKYASEKKESFNTITSALDKLNNPDLEEIVKSPLVPQKIKNVTIMTKGYSLDSFLNPPGILNIQRIGDEGSFGLSYSARCILENGEKPKNNEQYSIDYISQNINKSSREFQFIKYLNKDRFDKLSNKFSLMLKDNYDKTTYNNYSSALGKARLDMDEAYNNYTDLPPSITKRIYQLAKQITAGKVSDYDKASAIEKYFHTNDFKYDLSPKALPTDSKDYNDYFLFDSKRGYCVQFASAMVVLARASGLPARFVAGFVADEKDEKTRNYIIREKDAHAFPEVYIAGYGWMVFEPTVSSDDTGFSFASFAANMLKFIKSFVSGIVNSLAVVPFYIKMMFIPIIIIMILIIMKLISILCRKMWTKKIFKVSSKDAIEDLLSKLTVLLGKISCGKEKFETPSNYAARVYKEKNISIDYIVEVFNQSKYGGIDPTYEEISKALDSYNTVLTEVKSKLNKIRAWIL